MSVWRFIAVCFALQYGILHAQDNMGIANSNYAPTNSIFLNPSSSADSKAFIDFNFFGNSLHINNNHVFVNQSLLGLSEASGDEPIENFNRSSAPYKAFVDNQFHGPSFSISFGRFGGGLFTNVRSVTSINGISNHLANHAVNGFDFQDQIGEEFTTSNLRLGTLTWLEYGANFSYILSQKGRDMYTVGGNLKYLNGVAGAGLNIQEWNYAVRNDSIIESYTFRGDFGINDLNTDEPDRSSLLGNGNGLGLDLGFNYKKMLKSAQNYEPHTKSGCLLKDYQYKFGLSILDLGRVRMRNSYYREFDNQDSLVWENYSNASADNVEDIDQLITNELSDSTSVVFSDEFKLRLPAAISLQFDYNLGKGFYANATLIHGFTRNRRLGVERASSLSLTPRYARRQVEVALPLTLQDYERVRLGLALRVYSVVLGTDNLGALIGGGDQYGADFYFSFKYTMFRPWYCKDQLKRAKAKGSKRGRRKGGVACPSW
ncbi:MAG: DUF5723 family protein [Flavobacteriales bacterium]